MCVYGMEGPGGYQFVGRTAQVWNRFHVTREFEAGKPWLLRFFDQIRFHEVSAEDLLAFRDRFLTGKAGMTIEETTFSLTAYRKFLGENAKAIGVFKATQQASFEAERARWQESDRAGAIVNDAGTGDPGDESLAVGHTAVQSPVPGAVWKIAVEQGKRVVAGDVLVVVESMKMEMLVHAPSDGIVHELKCAEGRAVSLGQTLVLAEDTA
jgi:urea carboxylase